MYRTQVVRVAIVNYLCDMFFFFQAEDGIRDLIVTGVQTCALPIWWPMGSWTDTPLAEPLYGALSSDGWGSLLHYKPVSTQIAPSNPILAVPGNQIISAYSTLTFQVSATGSTSTQIVTLSATSLPTNSTFLPVTGNTVSGTFSWTPTHSQVGTYTVGFTAIDTSNSALYTTQTVSIQAQDAISIVITNPPILAVPGSQIVDAYSTITFRVIAAGSTSNQVVRLSASSLPANSTFPSVTGNTVSETFSWIPTLNLVGSYTVGFTAMDTSNSSLYTTGTVVIQVQSLVSGKVNIAPVLVVPGAEMVTVGSTLTFRVNATDADVPIETLALSVSSQPAGSTFDASKGTFSWTPKSGEEGSYVIAFKATDNGTPQMSVAKTVNVQVTSGPGGSGGSGGSCFLCGPLSPLGSISSISTMLWLLLVGITLDFGVSAMVVRSRTYKHHGVSQARP